MTKRECRNPHRPVGENEEAEIINLAIECFAWDKKKVISWYNKENPRLNKARPRELVERGQSEQVSEFLVSRRDERLKNEKAKKGREND